MEPTAHPFTITVTAALTGEPFCAFTSPHGGSLYVRYLKLAIQKRLGLRSPFTVRLLHGTDTPDDFCHLREITDTNAIHLEVLLRRSRMQKASSFMLSFGSYDPLQKKKKR